MATRNSKSRVVSAPCQYSTLKTKQGAKNDDEFRFLPGLYDVSNPRFAKKHYLTYVMRPSGSEINNSYIRYYLSKKNKDEFGENKSGVQKRYLLDEYPGFQSFIESCLIEVIGPNLPDLEKRWSEREFIAGLSYFLEYLASDQAEEKIKNIYDIDGQTQVNFYEYAELKPLDATGVRYGYRFFLEVAKKTGKFKARGMVLGGTSGTPAYPTTVIYKLDYCARKALEKHTALYNLYKEAVEELKELGELFTLENLLKTRYSKANSRNSVFLLSLDNLIKRDYGVEAKLWNHKNKDKFLYPNEEARKKHMGLIKTSEKGIDIAPKTLPLRLGWFLKMYPDWPSNVKKNSKYSGLFTERYSAYARNIGLDLDELNTYYRPSAEIIYPLFLLLQIRTGKNTQPLTDLKIEKTDGKGYTLGKRLDDGGRQIFSVKSKTNSEDYIFLHTDKEIDYYIEAFLEWFGPVVYARSSYENFFQGVNVHRNKVGFFTQPRRTLASKKLLEDYKIFDEEAKVQLEFVNHMRLRPSFVGASYLMGLKEYEIKHALRHEQESLQHLHYSNHAESKDHKIRKLAWAQRQIVDLFKGTIINIGANELKLGKGILSDCANNKDPTHSRKQKLKENQDCSDWMYCLLCEQSRPIKELHGPVIIAMKLYLEELEAYMPAREWEKEFSEIYDSIESVLLHFSEKEKEECGKKAHKHRVLCEHAIFMRRKRKIKEESSNENETA